MLFPTLGVWPKSLVVIQLEHRSETDYTDHTSIKAISNLRFSSEFNYSPVSTSYIRNILDHLNPRKAVGVDGISPRILRLGSPVLPEKVTKLISFYILNRSLPSEWKQARLAPVFKWEIDRQSKLPPCLNINFAIEGI